MYKYVALIPARGGSKSIPLKNIKEMAGKPLIYWTIESALNSAKIDKVYLSTDSQEIRRVTEAIQADKLEVIDRNPENATDTASTESVMMEFLESHDFENIVLIQATSPLLTSFDLDEAIEQYEKSKSDSLLSVVRQSRFIWKQDKDGFVRAKNYDPSRRPRRQDFEGYFVENGAFYITSKEALCSTKCRLSGNIAHYEMPDDTYIEIDEPSDWLIVEKLLITRLKSTQHRDSIFKNIKMLITDVDGVMTDCGMYYSQKNDELKKFNTRDGMGIQLLQENGIKVAIITKERTQIVNQRAKKLKIEELYQGIDNKLDVLEEIKKKYSLDYTEIAYIGDDINDIPVLEKVGLSFCPNDAVDDVKNICKVIAKEKGGNGVVREFYELMKQYNSFI